MNAKKGWRDMEQKRNNDLRIRSIVISEGENRAPNRAMLRAVGFTDEDFNKPMIGIARKGIYPRDIMTKKRLKMLLP